MFLLCVRTESHTGATWSIAFLVVEGVVVSVCTTFLVATFGGSSGIVYIEIIIIRVRIKRATVSLFLSSFTLLILAINSNQTFDFLLESAHFGLVVLVLF